MKRSLLVCFLLLSFLKAEESYVFEAKGEFAKELKELVEKHSKDEGVDIKVYQAPSGNQNVGDDRFLGIGLNTQIQYSKEQGEKIYNDNCLKCHGENGTKRSASGVRRLSQMSGEEIYMSFNAYVNDPSHGTGHRVTMAPIADRITSTELGYIIAYLKGEDDFIFRKYEQTNTNISRNPTTQGTYLK